MESIKEQPNLEADLSRRSEAEAEKKEKEPKISYHFFYSPHSTAKDFENLDKAFKEADIYVPEAFGWTPDQKNTVESISCGEMSLREIYYRNPFIIENTPQFRQFEMLYNSKKPILWVDISERETELLKKEEQAESFYEQAKKMFRLNFFPEAIKKIRACVEASAEFNLERQAKIKENLKKELEKFLQQNPEHQNRKELKVLISLGAIHTNIYHQLKKEGLFVSRELSGSPIVYPFLQEAERKTMLGKELDDEILARAIVENFLMPKLKELTSKGHKLMWILKKLISKLTLKDIEQISEDYYQEPNLDIVEELEKFNIKIPKSEEEIDEILGLKSKEEKK